MHAQSRGNNGSGKSMGTKGAAAALLLALGLAAPAHATNFVVNNAGDSGPGTLRQAVLDANAATGPHTISFTLPTGSTITLTSGQIAFAGPDVTVQGPGRDTLTISGDHDTRIFDVEAGSLTLNDMTLRDGLALGDATNFYDELGGAIRVGALPPPITPARFKALWAAARLQVRAETGDGDRSGRTRSAGLRTLQLLQSLQAPSIPSVSPPGLTLNHVALLDNRADAPDLAVGGAISVQGGSTLVVRNSLFIGNSTPFGGGAIFAMGSNDFSLVSAGSVDIQGSTFMLNHIDQNGTETGQGAAVLIVGPGGSIRSSVFRDNYINDAPPEAFSEGFGGALLLAFGTLPITIDNTEISDNTIVLRPGAFSEGAGLYCQEDVGGTTPLTITNSTISNNLSEYGAAIEAGCNLQLFNSTLAGNISQNTHGDGDAVEMINNEGKFNATSTLIANPAAHVDLYVFHGAASLGTISKSLIFAPDPSTPPLPPDTLIGVDPLLFPLMNNGGPTRTHGLHAGSPAIDAGSNPQNLMFDQRGAGYPRVLGAAADIGAFEVDPDRIFANGFD